MFVGAIPRDLQRIVAEVAARWRSARLYVGCSGNFTIERILRTLELHSNDVSLYTCSLGVYPAAREDWVFTVAEEHREEWGEILDPLLTTARDRAAAILVLSEIMGGLGKSGIYWQRMIEATKREFPRLHKKVATGLDSLEVALTSFTPQDVAAWIDTVPQDEAMITFPPFYKAGYTHLYKGLEDLFDWPRPRFIEMDEAGRREFVAKVMARERWMFAVDHPLAEFEEHLLGVVQATPRNVPCYCYGRAPVRRISMPHQDVTPKPVPRLLPGQILGARIELRPLEPGVFNALRSLYLNPNIPPAAPPCPTGVYVDDLLVGAFCVQKSSIHALKEMPFDGPWYYLLSDFPVRPTDYPRLSALIVMAAHSKEAKLLAERVTRQRIRSVFTTAFTSRPSSMKYRGLMTLVTRKEIEKEDGSKGFMLNYLGPAGEYTLAQTLELWKEKHGHKEEEKRSGSGACPAPASGSGDGSAADPA